MGNDPFPFTAFNFNGIQGGHDFTQEEAVFHGKISFPGVGFLEETTSLPTENHEKEAHLFKNQNQVPKFDDLMLEEFSFDPLLQPLQPFEETTKLNNQGVASSESVQYNNKPVPSTSSISASLELLSNYASRFKRLKRQNISNTIKIESSVGRQKLSTEEIIRVAGERYIQLSTHWDDNICMPMHPYGFGLGGLSEEENRDIELTRFLLTAAERVRCEQFERASRILLHCELNSSACATPGQKVIFYFAQALRERIAKETGMITKLKGSEKNGEHELAQKMDRELSLKLACFQNIPFCQVMQLTGVQAIVERVASETKVHLIDLEIRCGVQWTALMQALAERRNTPVQLLKITAIGFRGKTKLEETGECLTSFAESLNLPFSFKAVSITDMMEIKEDHFEINDDEAVAVYAPFVLMTMISRPECLENLMGIIRNTKPCIMIVLEMEANHNSPSFGKRFIEALFFYSAYMDCLETCMKEENESRMIFEAVLSEAIRNIVAMEGKERTVRNVKIDVWRRFFARYRVVETGFSESSLYQANLVVKEFACGNFCTFDKNGETLTVGWKGTPLHSISAWKFL